MKLRYTSLQVDVAQRRAAPTSRPSSGMPGRGRRTAQPGRGRSRSRSSTRRPDGRLVYVMTDGGALPIAISDLVWQLRDRGPHRRDRHVRARVRRRLRSRVGPRRARDRAPRGARRRGRSSRWDPGSAGSGSRLGFSGIEVGPILDAATRARTASRSRALRIVVRRSRARATRASRTTASPRSRSPPAAACSVAVPTRRRRRRGADPRATSPRRASTPATTSSTSTRSASSTLLAAHGLHVESMGRPAAADPVLFEAAAVAGRPRRASRSPRTASPASVG